MVAFLVPFLPSYASTGSFKFVCRRPALATMTTSVHAKIVRQGYFNPLDLRQGNLEPGCTDFNRFNAYILGILSDAVYGDLDANRLLSIARAVDPNFTQVFPFSNRNSQVAVFDHKECIAVVWRGSNDGDAVGSDWKDNLDYDLTDVYRVDECPVQFHLGFWRHVEQVWNPPVPDRAGDNHGVKALLRQLLSTRKRKLFFAGHSLGGAVAVVAANRFLLEGGSLHDIAQIVTFGQPRALHGQSVDQLLSKKLGSRYFRYVNETDLVPLLPISRNFSHGGTLKFVTNGNKVLTNPGAGTMVYRKFASFIMNLIQLKFSVSGDHDVKLYWDVALNGLYEE